MIFICRELTSSSTLQEKEPAEIAQLRRDFLKVRWFAHSFKQHPRDPQSSQQKIDDFEELRLKLVVKYENAVKQAGSKPFRWRNSHLEYFFYRNPQLLSRTNMSSMTMEIALSLMTEVCP